MLPLVYQRMIYAEGTKKILADLTYENLQTLEFNIKFSANPCMNWNNVDISLPNKTKRATDDVSDIAENLISVNKFLDDLRILLKNNIDVSRYSDTILIHIPKNILNCFLKNTFLLQKKLH